MDFRAPFRVRTTALATAQTYSDHGFRPQLPTTALDHGPQPRVPCTDFEHGTEYSTEYSTRSGVGQGQATDRNHRKGERHR
jgi:hypothetical protein